MAKTKKRAVHSDFGPKEATQPSHGGVRIDRVKIEGYEDRDHVRRNLTAPLEYYKGKQIITPNQHLAGSVLRKLYNQAGAQESMTPEYAERIGKGSVQSFREYKRKILQAYNEALHFVGPQDALVVRRVCCEEEFVSDPVDRKKLKSGLNRLINWFDKRRSER